MTVTGGPIRAAPLATTDGLPSQELPPAMELLADASSFVGRSVERDSFAGCGNGPEPGSGWWRR